jgi:glycosyltransferase involved in cell wall biosynthesis
VLISICIPTYNSGEKLERLLDSIHIQTYKKFEIIISDDSSNAGVKNLIDAKYADLNIRYFHNLKALGTPDNWNNAIAKSKGDWIKLMHHDDWFIDSNVLQLFIETIRKNEDVDMIFCAHQNIFFDKGTKENMYYSRIDLFLLKLSYLNLFKTFMGNPSCTLINSRCKPYLYDKRFKWLIDFDFFTEFFKKNKKFVCINKMLINLGMDSTQVTASVFQNPLVEVPESIGLINKHGEDILKNIFVYDFFWRLYRNINIRGLNSFNGYLGYNCDIEPIKNMIVAQEKININKLQIGVVSKCMMARSFIKNYLAG